MKVISTVLFCLLVVVSTARMSSIKNNLGGVQLEADSLGADFDVAVMIKNFIKGANLTESIPHSDDCSLATIEFSQKLTAALQELNKVRNLNNFYGVLEALAHFTPVVEGCFETFIEVEKEIGSYIKQFKSPVQYIDSFKNNFKQNVFLISAEATQLRNDLVALNFNEAAFDFGQLLNHLLVFDNTARAPMTPFNSILYMSPMTYNNGIPSNFQDFVDGYLNGTVVFNTEHNLACANSTRWWIEAVDAAIAAFNKGGADNQKEGWMYIAKSFSMLYPVTYNCITGVEEQIQAFFTHADWEEPWNIAYRIGRNLPMIRTAIMEAQADMKTGNYNGAGNDIGQLVYFLLFEGQE